MFCYVVLSACAHTYMYTINFSIETKLTMFFFMFLNFLQVVSVLFPCQLNEIFSQNQRLASNSLHGQDWL